MENLIIDYFNLYPMSFVPISEDELDDHLQDLNLVLSAIKNRRIKFFSSDCQLIRIPEEYDVLLRDKFPIPPLNPELRVAGFHFDLVRLPVFFDPWKGDYVGNYVFLACLTNNPSCSRFKFFIPNDLKNSLKEGTITCSDFLSERIYPVYIYDYRVRQKFYYYAEPMTTFTFYDLLSGFDTLPVSVVGLLDQGLKIVYSASGERIDFDVSANLYYLLFSFLFSGLYYVSDTSLIQLSGVFCNFIIKRLSSPYTFTCTFRHWMQVLDYDFNWRGVFRLSSSSLGVQFLDKVVPDSTPFWDNAPDGNWFRLANRIRGYYVPTLFEDFNCNMRVLESPTIV